MEKNLEIDIKQATIWQLKYLVKHLSMKSINATTPEIKADKEEYRKYLVKILLKDIDFQCKGNKESAKISLLKPHLVKIMESPYFLSSYVFDIFSEISNLMDIYNDILRHLKLKVSEQLVFLLGIYYYSVS